MQFIKSAITNLILTGADFIPSTLNYGAKIKCYILGTLLSRKPANVVFSNGFRMHCPGNVSIGNSTSFGVDNLICAYDKIEIGSHVMFSARVTVIAGSHDIHSFNPIKNNTVKIGDGVWIGACVTIVGKSIIGNGAVIGAGALVKGDIPPFSIAVGVPAKIIGQRKPSELIWHLCGAYHRSEL